MLSNWQCRHGNSIYHVLHLREEGGMNGMAGEEEGHEWDGWGGGA